ncbi:MAG: DUF456 family protein [Acidimicrobiia bacterium]|nr:DUF456 family protein [Acidimicrobiia bacterium]
MGSALTIVLVALAMVVGLAGTVVPILPGLLLVWAAAVVYGLVEGFGTVGVISMAVITVVGAAGSVAGVVLPSRAAGGSGAARSSLWLGVLGAVVGFFVVPVVGFPLGGALGIYVGEQLRTGDPRAAARATRATLRGFGAAVLVQLAAGVAMMATWAGWAILAWPGG